MKGSDRSPRAKGLRDSLKHVYGFLKHVYEISRKESTTEIKEFLKTLLPFVRDPCTPGLGFAPEPRIHKLPAVSLSTSG